MAATPLRRELVRSPASIEHRRALAQRQAGGAKACRRRWPWLSNHDPRPSNGSTGHAARVALGGWSDFCGVHATVNSTLAGILVTMACTTKTMLVVGRRAMPSSAEAVACQLKPWGVWLGAVLAARKGGCALVGCATTWTTHPARSTLLATFASGALIHHSMSAETVAALAASSPLRFGQAHGAVILSLAHFPGYAQATKSSASSSASSFVAPSVTALARRIAFQSRYHAFLE